MQIMKYKLNLNVNFTFIRIYRDIFFHHKISEKAFVCKKKKKQKMTLHTKI